MKIKTLALAAMLAACTSALAAALPDGAADTGVTPLDVSPLPWGVGSNVDATNSPFSVGQRDRIGFDDRWNGYGFVHPGGSGVRLQRSETPTEAQSPTAGVLPLWRDEQVFPGSTAEASDPEVETNALMLAGLGTIVLLVRRRLRD
jgi:hypothetical protein